MKKQLIRLTESDLHNIIRESVNRILQEEFQITLSNDGKEGFQNMMNSVAAINELKKTGETTIVIPTDNGDTVRAKLSQTQNNTIYVDSSTIKKEFNSVDDAIKALKDCARKI